MTSLMSHNCEYVEPMRVELVRYGATVVAAVFGDIDLTCAGRLQARLGELLGSARRLVLDLSDVHFMDSTGLHCVLDVHLASRAAGVEFVLVPGPPQVHRIFQITQTDELLHFAETSAE